MNIRKKISEIVLLTLAVVVGGGYVYYSLLTTSGDKFSKNPVVVFNNTPVVGTNSSIGSISTKKLHKAAPSQRNSMTPGMTGGTQLPSMAGRTAAGSHATGMLSGSTGYSYSYSAKPKDNKNSSSGGSDLGGMLAYGSRGGRNAGEDVQSATGGVTLSETGATTPFAVPKTPTTTPPNNGNGIYLVDPGTYTTQGNEMGNEDAIPVGEGGWILMLLALGYVGWKKK